VYDVASVSTLTLLGVLSATLTIMAFLPYIRDTLSGYTQPQSASWMIWSILSAVALASQAYEGATSSLWFAGAQACGTILIALLSMRRGLWRCFSRQDLGILAMAGLGLFLWYATENAAYALAMTITISLLGGAVTVRKAYRDPSSETPATWALNWIASVCAIIAVGDLNWILLAYPIYLCALNAAILAAISLGNTQTARITGPLRP